MIPENIQRYLRRYSIRYEVLDHPVAITAQELAQALDISGHRVAKSVLVDIEGTRCLAVLPATGRINTEQLAAEVGAESARICSEEEFGEYFPDCELGAEPPFGRLYGLPLIVEEQLSNADQIVFNAGSHMTAVRMSYAALDLLENPRLAGFSEPFPQSQQPREQEAP